VVLLAFLLQVVLISASGVVSPGPVTAVTLTLGARNRHAGALVGLGHGLLEVPLMILIVLGADRVLNARLFQIAVGLAGGMVLLYMGLQMFRDSGKGLGQADTNSRPGNPIVTGFVLSASNPFFLIWWAAVGLSLAMRAKELGVLAFVLFTVTHITCDIVWLEILSQASFRGAKVLSDKAFATVLKICAVVLLYFAGVFFWSSLRTLLAGGS
jgi:threonine/homoserine/homoserine lactone efflux protein